MVLDRKDERGNVMLVAFYISDSVPDHILGDALPETSDDASHPIDISDDGLDEEACKNFLRQQLPAYMIPSRFIHLEPISVDAQR